MKITHEKLGFGGGVIFHFALSVSAYLDIVGLVLPSTPQFLLLWPSNPRHEEYEP